MMGNKIPFNLVVGPPLSGKSTVCKYMSTKLGFTVFDMNAITEKLKLIPDPGEEEPNPDKEVSTNDIITDVFQTIENDQKAGLKK